MPERLQNGHVCIHSNNASLCGEYPFVLICNDYHEQNFSNSCTSVSANDGAFASSIHANRQLLGALHKDCIGISLSWIWSITWHVFGVSLGQSLAGQE